METFRAEEMPYQKPCTLEALSAAASGGFVGALYGFGESALEEFIKFPRVLLQ